MTNTNKVSEVVEGTRVNPGVVLHSFPHGASYACGGAATAALKAWEKLAYTRGKRNSRGVFFRTRSDS